MPTQRCPWAATAGSRTAATDPFGGGKWRQTRGQVEIAMTSRSPRPARRSEESRSIDAHAGCPERPLGIGHRSHRRRRVDIGPVCSERLLLGGTEPIQLLECGRRLRFAEDFGIYRPRSWGVSFEVGREFQRLGIRPATCRVTPRLQVVYTEVDRRLQVMAFPPGRQRRSIGGFGVWNDASEAGPQPLH